MSCWNNLLQSYQVQPLRSADFIISIRNHFYLGYPCHQKRINSLHMEMKEQWNWLESATLIPFACSCIGASQSWPLLQITKPNPFAVWAGDHLWKRNLASQSQAKKENPNLCLLLSENTAINLSRTVFYYFKETKSIPSTGCFMNRSGAYKCQAPGNSSTLVPREQQKFWLGALMIIAVTWEVDRDLKCATTTTLERKEAFPEITALHYVAFSTLANLERKSLGFLI